MIGKRTLVVGGLVAALAVPAGVAVAATGTPSPSPSQTGPATTQPSPGYGRMMGGVGDPEDCPFHDSAEAQQWRQQRSERQQLSPAERQKLVQQHRELMWRLHDPSTTS